MPVNEKLVLQLLRQRLRRARLARGWTQEEFAEKLDTSLRYVQQIEAVTGNFNPSIRTLTRIAGMLETDLFTLMQPPTPEEVASLTDPPKLGRVKRKLHT